MKKIEFQTCYDCPILQKCKIGQSRLIGVGTFTVKLAGCYNFDKKNGTRQEQRRLNI